MKKDIFIPNEIETIVDSLKTAFAITNITENAGVSTIETNTIRVFDNIVGDVFDLKDGMIVTIGNKNYAVSNVTHTTTIDTFEVTGTGITANEWNVAANFQTGSTKEIQEILARDVGNLDRFPLLWLLPSLDLDYDSPQIDFEADVNIVFAHKANATDFTEKRYDNNIEPVIQPLMTLFNRWLQSSDFNYMLEFNGVGKPIDYNKNIFPFFGDTNKEKSVLDVITDAIEVNYTLQFKRQY